MKFMLIAGAILAVLSPVSANSSSARSPGNPVLANSSEAQANRAVVLRVESLGKSGVRSVVIRRPAGESTQDFILVTAATNSADLAKAVATLLYSRRTQGPRLTRELRADISPAAVSAGLQTKDAQRATRDLASLAHARVVRIEGVGRGPAIGITTVSVTASQKKK